MTKEIKFKIDEIPEKGYLIKDNYAICRDECGDIRVSKVEKPKTPKRVDSAGFLVKEKEPEDYDPNCMDDAMDQQKAFLLDSKKEPIRVDRAGFSVNENVGSRKDCYWKHRVRELLFERDVKYREKEESKHPICPHCNNTIDFSHSDKGKGFLIQCKKCGGDVNYYPYEEKESETSSVKYAIDNKLMDEKEAKQHSFGKGSGKSDRGRNPGVNQQQLEIKGSGHTLPSDPEEPLDVNKPFSSYINWEEMKHVKKHEDHPIDCSKCDVECKEIYCLEEEAMATEPEEPHNCDKCGKSFYCEEDWCHDCTKAYFVAEVAERLKEFLVETNKAFEKINAGGDFSISILTTWVLCEIERLIKELMDKK